MSNYDIVKRLKKIPTAYLSVADKSAIQDAIKVLDKPLIALGDYESSNLKEALLVLEELGLNTGDWLHEINDQLDSNDYRPNRTKEDQVQIVKGKYGTKTI